MPLAVSPPKPATLIIPPPMGSSSSHNTMSLGIDRSLFSPTSRETDTLSLASLLTPSVELAVHVQSPMAPSPFTPSSPGVDLILRTSDGVPFYVHRIILALASPFFADMLSLPQPNMKPTSPSSSSAPIPTVDISEPSSILAILLQLTYPLPEPSTPSLTLLSSLLAASTKYDLVRATSVLRRHLVSPAYLSEHPTRVYAIACRFELEEEMDLAMHATLKVQVLDCELAEELKWITAWQYHRLLELHKRVGLQLCQIIESAVPSPSSPTLYVPPSPPYSSHPSCPQCSSSHYGSLCPPRWWTDFMLRACTEVRKRPAVDVVFGTDFLGKSAVNGCLRCSGSVWEASAKGGFLEDVRRRCEVVLSGAGGKGSDVVGA